MLFQCRYFRLQLLEPVFDNDNLCSGILDHEKPLAIRRYVERASACEVAVRQNGLHLADAETRLAPNGRTHQLAGRGEVEEFVALLAPDRRGASVLRHGPAAIVHPWEWPHVRLGLPGFS